MSSDEKNVRHRFAVPTADAVVHEWIANQSNLGFSIRVLIKAFVRDYGYKDATCLELGTTVKRRGRPSKQAKIAYGLVSDDEQGEFEETEEIEAAGPVSVPRQGINDYKSTSVPEEKLTKSESIVTDPKQDVYIPAKKQEEPSDDLANMFAEQNQPVNKPSVPTDDDGFVDPEDLFV